MKKRILALLLAALMVVSLLPTMAFAGETDWSSISWIYNGTANADYTECFKADDVNGAEVVGIAKPGYALEAGIHVICSEAIIDCSLGSSNFDIRGTDIILHASAFTDRVTEVTIRYATGTGSLIVYNKNGAFAVTHDLTVKKSDNTDATLGDDYAWDTADTNKLIIKANGLTVSGTTTKEYIYVESTVTSLTIKDLTIDTVNQRNIDFGGSATLTLVGTNCLSSTSMVSVLFAGNGTITGDGDLSATSIESNALRANGTFTLDCSGTITADGCKRGIYGVTQIVVTANTGKILVYGNSNSWGAFVWDTDMPSIDASLTVTGSATYQANEADIVDEVTYNSAGYTKVGGNPAKSVLFKAPPHTHNLVKVDGQAATEEAAGFKDYYECKDSEGACHKYFEDTNGTTPIADLAAWKAQDGNGYIDPLNHNPAFKQGKAATFDEPGYKPYYFCDNCGRNYYSEDALGFVEISDINAWKSKGGDGYIPSGKEKLTVTDFDDEPVSQSSETYEVKEDGIHIYSGDIIFSGEIDETVFIEGPENAVTFTNLVIKNSVYANNLSENVIIYMNGAAIEGDVAATGNGTEDLYLCISIENDNEIKGDITSDGSVTVYGFPGATLDVKSAKATTLLYLSGLRLENMKEVYNLETTLTATPDDASKPVTFAVKKEAVFPDEEEFILNGGKPFAYGEDYNIAPPVVCDENGTPFEPQPELTVVYYELITDGEWDWEIKAVEGKPTKEGTYLITFYMPESDPYYTGSRFYEYTIAKEIPASFTVTFNMNGHGTEIEKQIVENGNKVTKPADPAANGYTFDGWYTDATFSVKFDFDSAVTKDTTIYAKWTENAVTPADPTSPRTGDAGNMALWVMLLALSSMGLCACLVFGKKRKNEQ